MAGAWKSAPVVFEWYGDYNYLQSQNWSFDDAVKFMLDNHVTMINNNLGSVPVAQQEKVRQLARLAGYRFVLKSGNFRLEGKNAISINMAWINRGVGKLYRWFELRLALVGADGNRIGERALRSDPRDWLPGNTNVEGLFALPVGLALGEYKLVTALVDPTGVLPPLQLAIDGPSLDGWTELGDFAVQR
jgi:hypothetical protein